MGAPPDHGIVGRDDELLRLGRLVSLVANGQGGLAWVQGEPGIGKTALIDAVSGHASMSGCTVLRAAGDELDQAFPLRLMAESVGASVRSTDPTLEQIAGLLRGETGGSGAIDPVLAATERLLEFVDRVCAAGPAVLVAEDLHWADEPSLVAWNRLAQAVDQIPLLLVATCRPMPSRPIVTRLREMVQQRRGELMDVGSLADADVHELATKIAGAPPGRRLRGELARAGGNPLYVRELVDALIRDRLVDVANGVAEFHGESGATPDSLAVAIGGRLRFHGTDALDVLRIAALLGAEFGLDELSIASGRPVAKLSGVVEKAIAAGALRDVGARLMFRHELIRHMLAEQVSTATRAALHSHLARELAGAGRSVDVVARHLLAVPQIADRWVAPWLAQVPEATLYAAPDVAAELLTRTIASIDADDPSWEVLAARVAHVSYLLGRDDEAGAMAEAVAHRSSDVELAARMKILMLRSVGRAGRPADAVAMSAAPVDGNVSLSRRATMRAWTSVNQALAGQVEEARADAQAALDQAARSGDRLTIAYALHASTLVSDTPSALKSIDEALAGLGDDPESTDLRLMLTNNRLTYLTQLGRWTEAEAALPPALVLAERAGTFRAAWLVATAAEICYLHGTWDEALVHIGGISSEFLGLTANLTAPALGMLIALHRGQRDKADGYLRAAGVEESAVPALVRRPLNWRLAAGWALRAEIDGDLHRALDWLAILLDPILPPGQQTRQEMMPHLVRVALAVGDRATAAAAAEVSRADAAEDPQPDRVAAVRCCQAQLDDDADALLNAADDFRAHGSPLLRALALEEAAVRLAQAGETTRARPAFTDALRTYSYLGATWDSRRVEVRLRPYGIRRGPRTLHRRATSGWESLTDAETRIAGLVARGWSNPDIASELFLSRRTVQTHVSNILAKLGLKSRLEIMREAVRA